MPRKYLKKTISLNGNFDVDTDYGDNYPRDYFTLHYTFHKYFELQVYTSKMQLLVTFYTIDYPNNETLWY